MMTNYLLNILYLAYIIFIFLYIYFILFWYFIIYKNIFYMWYLWNPKVQNSTWITTFAIQNNALCIQFYISHNSKNLQKHLQTDSVLWTIENLSEIRNLTFRPFSWFYFMPKGFSSWADFGPNWMHSGVNRRTAMAYSFSLRTRWSFDSEQSVGFCESFCQCHVRSQFVIQL